MKKKFQLITILAISILSLGIFGYYQYPYWYGHRQLDKISLSDFKSKEAKILAKDLTYSFKLVFDEVYKNGMIIINQESEQYEERKKRLIEKGAEAGLTPVNDLYKKYHIKDEGDKVSIDKHISNCINVNNKSLHDLDPKRFPY